MTPQGPAGRPAGRPEICVGVVVEPGPVPLWMHRCIDRLAAEPGVRLAAVVRPGPAPAQITRRPAARRPAALRTTAAPPALAGLPVVPALDTPGAPVLDVLLDLAGSDPSPGPVCWPRLGVWRFGFGPETAPDAHRVAGTDLVDARPTAVVRILAHAGDGRSTLLRESTTRAIGHSPARHVDRLLLRASDLPALACRDLRAGGPPAELASPPVAAPVPGVPAARLWWRLAVNHLAWALGFLRDDQWHIGIVDAPIASFLRPEEVPAPRWLPEPPGDAFHADPFPFDRGRSIVFERYSLRDRRGILCAVDLVGQPEVPRPVATPDHHIAYPFAFEHDGRTYCTPETAAADEVGLYTLGGDPVRLDKVATLVDGVAAVDPTVTFHGGRWWLLFTDGRGDPDADLHVWHAADLVGPWSPHRRNPVKMDVRSARPAGTPFVVDGVLHRPAMDNSRTYGGRVVINRVVELTPDTFRERPAAVVPPFPGPFGRGIHTLAAAGPVTIVDGKRVRTVPTLLPAKVVHRLSDRGRPPV